MEVGGEGKAVKGRRSLCLLPPKYNGLQSRHDQAKISGNISTLTFIPVPQIAHSKKAALRHHIWFRVLTRLERGVLDLTSRYVVRIKSPILANVVTAILKKLELASESLLDRLVRTIGFSLAKKISGLAKNWGNLSATKWADDADLARYLAVTHLNSNRPT
jgi:hypothetical protein